MSSEFSEVVTKLEREYTRLADKFGDSPEATQQADRITQERRMLKLLEVGDVSKSRILDFGCGTGQLLAVIRNSVDFTGGFTGYDITPGLIAIAKRKFPDEEFEVRNIFEEGVQEDFDYIFISGVFNNFTGNNWDWMTCALRILFPKARKGLAFNNLSRYVDYFDRGLYYVDPARVLQFCKEELSPYVKICHDYSLRDGVIPYEFSTFVYPADLPPRRLNDGALQE